MTGNVLEARPPELSLDDACDTVVRLYGLEGTLTPLAGERDRNYRLACPDATYALKIGNPADPIAAVEMQALALEHALACDPTLPIPRVQRTVEGTLVGEHELGGVTHAVQLVTFLDGRPHDPELASPSLRRSVGATAARLDRALAGFTHHASERSLAWDVTRLLELGPLLDRVAPDRRAVVNGVFERFETHTAQALMRLRRSVIHGDLSLGNLLVDRDDRDRIAGIVDFGDLVCAATVLETAIAASYQAFRADDPVAAIGEVLSAYHVVSPLERAEVELVRDLVAARLAQSVVISAWRSELHPDNVAYITVDADDSYETLARLSAIEARHATEELLRACALDRPLTRTDAEALSLRTRRLGPALSLSYDTPVRLASGDGVWLHASDGTRLLDAYNNVPQVGHAHPRVTAALAAQAGRLATNTRYLVDRVTEYADRLAQLLPEPLGVVMFVNSGSEANDVALQIARVVTGARGVLITEHAYHGTTAVTAAVSPEELGAASHEPWVARLGGASTLVADNAAERVESEVGEAVGRLRTAGHEPAALLLDAVFSSDGIFGVPDGYLRAAYAAARAAGAVCIADEVQAGFGRVGTSFWGFAQDGVVPDIVTLGKPMGNGYPMGAVITTPEIAELFAARWHFFSTFAGSPVAAAVGDAVLDVIEGERLAEQAERVGTYLRGLLGELRPAYPVLSDVRGPGLFVGVELADAVLARRVTNHMREAGVLVGCTGSRQNVIKIRPPLQFAEHHADRLASALDDALRSSV